MLGPVRSGSSSLPGFSVSVSSGRTYLDSAYNKREYDGTAESVFDRKELKKPKLTVYMFENSSDKVVLTLNDKDVQQSKSYISSKEGCAYIISYSMKEAKEAEPPTIYVPGKPLLYQTPGDKDFPLKVKHDTGMHYMDEHAGRYPQFQYLPMLQAIPVTSPEFRFDEVHAVLNRTVLEKMTRFIKGASD